MVVGVRGCVTRRCGKSSAHRSTARLGGKQHLPVSQSKKGFQNHPGQAVLAHGLPNEADPSELCLLSEGLCGACSQIMGSFRWLSRHSTYLIA